MQIECIDDMDAHVILSIPDVIFNMSNCYKGILWTK